MRKLACALAFALVAGASAHAMAAAAAKPAAKPSPAKPAPAKRKTIDKSSPKQAPARPVKITADSLEVLPGDKRANWKGNVVAVRDDMTIRCKVLVADYDSAGADKQLKKLTCSGDAYMHQVAKDERPEREVWGDVAVFDNDTAILVVTGSPRAREGTSTMKGEKITFDSNADKLRVERVSMVIDTPPDKDPATKPKSATQAKAKEPGP